MGNRILAQIRHQVLVFDQAHAVVEYYDPHTSSEISRHIQALWRAITDVEQAIDLYGVDVETIERHELYHFIFFTSLFILYSLKQTIAIVRRGSSGCPTDIGVSSWDGAFWQADVDTTTGVLSEPRPLKGTISPDEYLPSAKHNGAKNEETQSPSFEVDNPAASAAAAIGPRQAAIERNLNL